MGRSIGLPNTAHPGQRVWGGLQFSHTQPRPPVHTVQVPRPGWPGCSNSSAYVVPQSGSRDDPPTCREDPEPSVSQKAERYQELRSWGRLLRLRGGALLDEVSFM